MIAVANAPCSWGALEFKIENGASDYRQVLYEIEETGYSGTELGDWGFMPTEPDALKAELAGHGLALVGAFVPVDLSNPCMHLPGEKRALKIAELLVKSGYENAFIILSDDNCKYTLRTRKAGRIKAEYGLNDDQWSVFAHGAERISKAVRRKWAIRTVFHHHCGGYVETPAEIDELMNRTDSEVMGLCLDMGHYRFGGGDPLQAIKKYSKRIWHVHFKDCHPKVAVSSTRNDWDYFESVRRGIFCELGKGEVDFTNIIGELKKQAYSGWIVVEQDVLPGMGSPKQCAFRNREYLKERGL